MAEPRLQNEVLVLFSSLNPSTKDTIPNRSLRLTSSTPTVPIGRTSKRKSSLEASPTNAYFDCPVMSRYHAELKLDTDKDSKQPLVYIVDHGSLHGTCLNRLPIQKDNQQRLRSDDIVTFGTAIERGQEKFTPHEVQAKIVFDTSIPNDKPITYRVPDETDAEEISSDEDDELSYGRELLRKHNIRPRQMDPIDLTSEVDASADSHEMHRYTDLLYRSRDPRGAYVDLTSSMEATSEKRPRHQTTEQSLNQHSGLKSTAGLDDLNHDWASASDGDFDIEDDEETSELSEHQPQSFASNIADVGVPGTNFLLSDEEEEEDEDDIEIDEDIDEDDESVDYEALGCLNGDSDDGEDSALDDGDITADHTGTTAETSVLSIANTPPCTEHVKGERSVLESTEEPAPGQPPLDSRNQIGYILGHSRGQTHESKANTSTTPRSFFPFLQHLAPTLPSMQRGNNQFALHPMNTRPTINPMTMGGQAMDTANLKSSKDDKAEFFRAREENRNNINDAGPFAPRRVGSPTSLNLVSSPLAQPLHGDMGFNPNSVATSSLLESGNQFLHAPLDNTLPKIPEREQSPPLDETSAYLFEASKKDIQATTPENTDSRRSIDIRDIIEAPPKTIPSCPTPKRKAEDISQSTPQEEEAIKMVQPDVAPHNPTALLQPEAPDTLQFPRACDTTAELQSNSQPPTKRLRRAAEVFGYAALGGIAVMSALIATAPAL